MPMYDYKCLSCEYEYDVFYASIKKAAAEEKQERCPKCDSFDKKRLISRNTGFQLKGNGWAKDRYGK